MINSFITGFEVSIGSEAFVGVINSFITGFEAIGPEVLFSIADSNLVNLSSSDFKSSFVEAIGSEVLVDKILLLSLIASLDGLDEQLIENIAKNIIKFVFIVLIIM